MDPEKVILSLLLVALPLPAVQCSEFYLASVGPAPLRFAQPPSSKPYVWPVALSQAVAQTNSSVDVTDSIPGISTNLITTPRLSSAQTNNSVTNVPQASTDATPGLPQGQLGADGNNLSASNLLLVTPQMLADYFKANLEMLSRWSTNGPPVPEIPFNPPTPKPPSSEAIYRVQ